MGLPEQILDAVKWISIIVTGTFCINYLIKGIIDFLIKDLSRKG